MENFPVKAVLLKKMELGDFDYILTYFTYEHGNISLIAKNAKKSKKRFSGKIELFTISEIMFSTPKRGGMPVLTEVLLNEPFENIRSSIIKICYAGYWSELITYCVPAYKPQEDIYHLLIFLLDMLNKEDVSPEASNLYFQVHFLKLTGFDPMLSHCASCGAAFDEVLKSFRFRYDKGGILCSRCSEFYNGTLSAANVKQITWIRKNGFETASKLKFSKKNINDCTDFLAGFLSYNSGKEFNSQRIVKAFES
ncbi:MAG: DNA repair protein RecO [Thermodesulfobacteriota bacterium]